MFVTLKSKNSYFATTTSNPACAIVLPVNPKSITQGDAFVKLSDLFTIFTSVQMVIREHENIEAYSKLKWYHPVIQSINNSYQVYCLQNGQFKLKYIDNQMPANSLKNLCLTSMNKFNVMIPL